MRKSIYIILCQSYLQLSLSCILKVSNCNTWESAFETDTRSEWIINDKRWGTWHIRKSHLALSRSYYMELTTQVPITSSQHSTMVKGALWISLLRSSVWRLLLKSLAKQHVTVNTRQNVTTSPLTTDRACHSTTLQQFWILMSTSVWRYRWSVRLLR